MSKRQIPTKYPIAPAHSALGKQGTRPVTASLQATADRVEAERHQHNAAIRRLGEANRRFNQRRGAPDGQK